jgi:GntR family transcriptional regulator
MATTTHEIDKQLDMPMYHQLYLILKDQIRSGLYEEGSLIPSEAKLQSRYGVSRITVRRAIAELENDGYVKRKKGKGSIVITREKYRDIFAFKSFSDDTRDKGETPGSIILELTNIQSNNQVARALDIKPEKRSSL